MLLERRLQSIRQNIVRVSDKATQCFGAIEVGKAHVVEVVRTALLHLLSKIQLALVDLKSGLGREKKTFSKGD